jgi:hypothetical protein
LCFFSNKSTVELEGDCFIYAMDRNIIRNLRKRNTMAKSLLLFILLLFVATWLIARPAVFIIPPMYEYPAGATLLYYDRATGAPFFTSTDSYCLYSTGDVTTRCRNAALNSIGPLLTNLLTTLPRLVSQRTYSGVDLDPQRSRLSPTNKPWILPIVPHLRSYS